MYEFDMFRHVVKRGLEILAPDCKFGVSGQTTLTSAQVTTGLTLSVLNAFNCYAMLIFKY